MRLVKAAVAATVVVFGCAVLTPASLPGQEKTKPAPISPSAGEPRDPASQIDPRHLPAAISPRAKDLKPADLSSKQLTGKWETGIYKKDKVVYSVFGTAEAAAKNEKLPLVVYFHGEAHNAKEGLHLQSGVRHFTTPAAQEENPCIVLAPFTPKGDMTGSKTFVSMIDDAIRNYPVDPGRIYLVAVDLGGWGAGSLLVRHPGHIAAMVDIVGLTAFTPRELDGDLAVWGVLGKSTSSKTRARNNAVLGYLEEMRRLGAKTNKTNLGVAHSKLEETFFSDPKNRAWLFKHSKKK